MAKQLRPELQAIQLAQQQTAQPPTSPRATAPAPTVPGYPAPLSASPVQPLPSPGTTPQPPRPQQQAGPAGQQPPQPPQPSQPPGQPPAQQQSMSAPAAVQPQITPAQQAAIVAAQQQTQSAASGLPRLPVGTTGGALEQTTGQTGAQLGFVDPRLPSNVQETLRNAYTALDAFRAWQAANPQGFDPYARYGGREEYERGVREGWLLPMSGIQRSNEELDFLNAIDSLRAALQGGANGPHAPGSILREMIPEEIWQAIQQRNLEVPAMVPQGYGIPGLGFHGNTPVYTGTGPPPPNLPPGTIIANNPTRPIVLPAAPQGSAFSIYRPAPTLSTGLPSQQSTSDGAGSSIISGGSPGQNIVATDPGTSLPRSILESILAGGSTGTDGSGTGGTSTGGTGTGGGSGTGGMTGGGSATSGPLPPFQTFGPGNDLRSTQINPVPSQNLEAMNRAIQRAMSALEGPDRATLAAQALEQIRRTTEDEYQREIRSIGQDAARLGRLGSGLVNEKLADARTARDEALAEASERLAREAAGLTLSDRIGVLSALSGLQGQTFAQEAATRGEFRGERAFQNQMQQQALSDLIRMLTLENALVGSDYSRQLSFLDALLRAGFGGLPSSALLGASNVFGQSAADMSNFINQFWQYYMLMGNPADAANASVGTYQGSGYA